MEVGTRVNTTFVQRGKQADSKLLRWNFASWACDYSFLYIFPEHWLHGRRQNVALKELSQAS